MTTVEEQKRIVKARCDAWKHEPELPIIKKQQLYPTDPPVIGPFWVSRSKLSRPPEYDFRTKIYEAFELLRTSPDQRIAPAHEVPVKDVPIEWMGPRANADSKAAEPKISESAKYAKLMEDADEPVIMHLHGGAFFVGSAGSWRAAPMRLTRATKFRIAAPTYRLAPQNPFPGALLDIFVAYLSLLSPPPGSLHRPVPASKIVLAGDSAGANLCLALLQVILTLKRAHPSYQPQVLFHGKHVPLLLPAGLTLLCTYADVTDAMPSHFKNGEYDILVQKQPPLLPRYPKDDSWPAKPPRGSMYTNAEALNHPLVSPTIAREWSGAPPIWFSAGAQERLFDSQKAIAYEAFRQGVVTLWNEYEGMCHCWPMILGKLPQSKHAFASWTEACTLFIENSASTLHKSLLTSKARRIHMPDCQEEILDLKRLQVLPFDEIERRMKLKIDEHPPWTGILTLKELKAFL